MSGKSVTITGKDGSFGGYLASPGSGRGPGIVVIQEIFGVNQGLRDIADGLASRGFFALVPDLFWRIRPGVELTDRTDAEWKEAFGLLQKFDIDKGPPTSRPPSASCARPRAPPARWGRWAIAWAASWPTCPPPAPTATPRWAITASASRISWTKPQT